MGNVLHSVVRMTQGQGGRSRHFRNGSGEDTSEMLYGITNIFPSKQVRRTENSFITPDLYGHLNAKQTQLIFENIKKNFDKAGKGHYLHAVPAGKRFS